MLTNLRWSGATRSARTASRSESWRSRNVITGRRYTARLTRDRRGGGPFKQSLVGCNWELRAAWLIRTSERMRFDWTIWSAHRAVPGSRRASGRRRPQVAAHRRQGSTACRPGPPSAASALPRLPHPANSRSRGVRWAGRRIPRSLHLRSRPSRLGTDHSRYFPGELMQPSRPSAGSRDASLEPPAQRARLCVVKPAR